MIFLHQIEEFLPRERRLRDVAPGKEDDKRWIGGMSEGEEKAEEGAGGVVVEEEEEEGGGTFKRDL